MTYVTENLLPLLSLFLLALMMAEILFVIRSRIGFFAEFVFSLGSILVLVFTLTPASSESDNIDILRNAFAVKLFVMLLSITLVSLVANEMLIKANSLLLQQLGIVLSVSLSVLSLPFCINVISCAMDSRNCSL